MTSTIIAGFAAFCTGVLGYLQWRLAKRAQQHVTEEEAHEETVAMARAMDERINAHFTRLEQAIAIAENKIEALEHQMGVLSKRLDRAIRYIKDNDLPWPPPGEEPL